MYAGVVVPNPRNSFPWWLLISVQSQVMTTSGIECFPPCNTGNESPGFRGSRDHDILLINAFETTCATLRGLPSRRGARSLGGGPVSRATGAPRLGRAGRSGGPG